MQNNNMKGFTLIELLAVIVILAAIALIATPIILGIINNAQKEAFKDTAYGLIDAAKYYYTVAITDDIEITEKTFTYPDNNELNISGKKPESGTVVVNSIGQIKLAIYSGKYCAQKDFSDNAVTVTETSAEDCVIAATLYTDSTLNGADPVLDSGMIPVIIAADGSVKKADTSSTWYNYNNKEWANAVLLSSDVRNSYNAGDTIDSSKILAYFVWIPRYKYAIPVGTGARQISIIFENKDTNKSTGTAVGTDYLTHPAFTFNSQELSGIWVGKFETSTEASSSCYTSTSKLNCDDTNQNPRILPNVNSLRNQVISNQFKTALKFGNRVLNGDGTVTNNGVSSDYGLVNESRMMKNDEWGAVAYLSRSAYGINDEIRLNNYWSSPNNMTGCGASTPDAAVASTCGIRYGDASDNNYPQSTTGNISGIFDMNGGAFEYVMGYLSTASATFGANSSSNYAGFTNTLANKYWDNYTSTDTSTACSGGACFGQALSETAGWYNDTVFFASTTYPWFLRGGSMNIVSSPGAFSYSAYMGDSLSTYSFRIVVSSGD